MSTPRALSILSRTLSRSPAQPIRSTSRLSPSSLRLTTTTTAAAAAAAAAAARHFSSRPRLSADPSIPSQSIPTSSIRTASATDASPSSSSTAHLTPAEQRIHASLTAGLSPSALTVQDVSGGCGSMFAIEISSEMFRGVGVLKQQRMVNALLRGQMDEEGWHGVQIKTTVG